MKFRLEDLQIVDEAAVPLKVRRSDWLELFKKIEPHKALIIKEEQAAPSTIREAVKKLISDGHLKGYEFVSRKGADGKSVSYIVNAAKSVGKPTR